MEISIGELIFLGFIGVMSLIGFGSMVVDKYKATKGLWRIPEKTLLLIAICGGGIGSFLGMQMVRHKTKKTAFQIILPITAIAYFAVCARLIAL